MECDNITEIADAIFSKPPGSPKSIQLELEEETAYAAQQEGVSEYVFEILCVLTLKGVEKLYGNTDILSLTEDQYNIVQQYVNSYGYILIITANDTNRTPWELLKEHQLLRCYRISFEPLV